MRALTIETYGTPEVVQVKEVAVPKPKPDQLLIKVKSASFNALDKHLTRGVILARPKTGLFKPRNKVLGSDLAGEVVAVGSLVSRFEVGDMVFGGNLVGAFADFAILEEKKAAKMPAGISFAEAAALPVAAGTALQALRMARLKTGQKVLINGGSGGVGTYLVQLAHLFGADVTAVCSGRNVEMVKALGADRVVNYQTDPVTGINERFELIIDNVGNLGIADYKRLLTRTGTAIVNGMTSVGGLLNVMIRAPFVSRKKGQQIRMLDAAVNTANLETLAAMVAAGELKVFIEKEYELAEARKGLEYLWTRRVRGKLIVNM